MFTVHFSTTHLTSRYRQRIAEFSTRVFAAERESAEAMRKRAILLSSGPYKTAWLRQQARRRGAGLYSVRDPAPPAPAYSINAQAQGFDALRNHWQMRGMQRPDGTAFTLWNSSGHARFMLGTSKMIARPILQQVHALEDDARLQRLIRAKRRALQK